MGHFVWLHNLTIGNPLISTLGLMPASHLSDTCVAAIESRKGNREAQNDMMERWLNMQNTCSERMAEAEVFAAAAANVAAGTETTTLSVNLWVVHRNPDLFGPDSNSFNPERWLDKERAKTMDYHLLHWGAGYNQCPGRNLAHFEISKLAATLLRDYKFERVDPKKEWSFKDHFITRSTDWPCWAKRREVEVGV
ncbi:cytochrome P450 [Aspergillus undulatus]|uniref:cytochrome P450 n=1 Tax=Aspergillus undulatus TaxID=1810928 RepID=UPI003CCCEF16